MNLSKIKNELQQVLQLVEDWQINGVDELERDLALGKLRKVYSTMRFDAAPQPETIDTDEHSASVSATTIEHTSTVVEPIEELPVGIAISLDDVFEDFVPEDLVPVNDGFGEEIAPTESVLFEQTEAEVQTTTTEELSEEPESEDAVGGIAAESSEEPEGDIEPMAEVENKESAEESDLDAIAEEAPPQEESSNEECVAPIAEPSLFGDEEMFVTRKSRRTRMMSLYDDNDSKFTILSENKNEAEEPTVDPQPIGKTIEPQTIVETAAEVTPVEQVVVDAPIVTVVEEFAETESECEEFVEVEVPASSVAYVSQCEMEQSVTMESATEKNEPYVEPQIEVAVAKPAVSAVPESEQVIGEVLKSDVRTIADIIAPKSSAADQFTKGAITDLNRAIGVNDRFLLIRDLFGGSSDAYDKVIWRLNNFDNLEDCLIYIAENFDWNPNSEGVKLIMELIERKYI